MSDAVHAIAEDLSSKMSVAGKLDVSSRKNSAASNEGRMGFNAGDIATPKNKSDKFKVSKEKKSVEFEGGTFVDVAIDLPPGLPPTSSVQGDFVPPFVPVSNSQVVALDLTSPARSTMPPTMSKNSKGQRGWRRPPTRGVGAGSVTSTPVKNASGGGGDRQTPRKSNIHRFALINQAPLNPLLAPIRGADSKASLQKAPKYPLLLVSNEGTMILTLATDVVVEICVDRSFRISTPDFLVLFSKHFQTKISPTKKLRMFTRKIHSKEKMEKYQTYVNRNGTYSSIMHRYAKLVHSNEHVHCKFSSANDKMAILGPEGILFSMNHLYEAFLVCNTGENKSRTALAMEKPTFPIQDIDYSLHQMYDQSEMGAKYFMQCNDIVDKATYERRTDGSLVMNINDMTIRNCSASGELTVEARPVTVRVNLHQLTVHLRSAHIDMGVQEKDKAYVKRGDKRIHVSRSGMVVSDGTCVTSMDLFGRIVSCT